MEKWRLEHPHDTPPYRFTPSPTFGNSSRCELYALMRIGQGHLGAKDWGRGMSEALRFGDETISAAMIEDADLHDHIIKGLYEANLAT